MDEVNLKERLERAVHKIADRILMSDPVYKSFYEKSNVMYLNAASKEARRQAQEVICKVKCELLEGYLKKLEEKTT